MNNLALQIDWYPGEAEIIIPKEDIPTSVFAEKYRAVTIGSHRGQWDNSVTPYLVGIMDAADRPWVEEIVISGPPQSGKTNACINILLKHIYLHGGNGKFIMFPMELLAKLFYRVRLVPILQGCPPLSGRLSPDPRDTTSEKVSLRDGTHLFPAWGSSAAKLSSFPADFVWADEIDKNAELTGDETDPLSLLEDRVRTARRRLILKCSSPTLETGHIWKALGRCLYQFHQYVVCPHCREEQRMTENRLTWPGQIGLFQKSDNGISQPDAQPELLKSMKIARYVCEGCAALWDDQERNQAVRLGGWKTADGTLLDAALTTRPRSVGFQIEGFCCPDISLSDLAAEIINARSGDPAAEKRRDNSFFGRPHIPEIAQRSEDVILKLCDDRPRGIVPDEAHIILMAADTQQNGFWYEVRAFRFGLDLKSWQIREGYAESFAELVEIADIPYCTAGGKEFRIGMECAVIDSGGGTGPVPQHSRTHEVYAHCIQDRRFIPIKGMSTQDAAKVRKKPVDFWPGSNKPIKAGLHRLNINTALFKNELSGKLSKHPDDQGAWVLHSEADHAYARQMTAENLIDGKWVCPRGKDNHFWDCGVYILALAEYKQLKLKKPADNSKPTAPTRPARTGWVKGNR